MGKYVGLVGKIGPAFSEGRMEHGRIEIAEEANDSTWIMRIPGLYFAEDRKECLRAAFDHLLACENYLKREK